MSDHITKLQQQGYVTIEMTQTVGGTAYQKLDSKIMSLYDKGHRKIAVVTNNNNPYVTRMGEIAARATRNLHGATVIVQTVTPEPEPELKQDQGAVPVVQ